MNLVLFLKAEQLSLFDSVVHVKAAVRDGKTVEPYTRVQKVAPVPFDRPRPTQLYRGTETGVAGLRRVSNGGEIGSAIYATPHKWLADSYGGGPKARVGAGRQVHSINIPQMAPEHYGYVHGGADKGTRATLQDHLGRVLHDYDGASNVPGHGRDKIREIAEAHGLKMIIGMPESIADNQVAILDPALIQDAPIDPTKPPGWEKLIAFENARAGAPLEWGGGLDGYGNLLFPEGIQGTRTRVMLSAAQVSAVHGEVFTHGHPNGCSFSRGDWECASNMDSQEYRAIGAKYAHSLKPGGVGKGNYRWPPASEMRQLYNRALKEVKKMDKKITHPVPTAPPVGHFYPAADSTHFWHMVNERAAELSNGWVKYERTERA
jgi:hypothetical protein